jgi:hypothetical protein
MIPHDVSMPRILILTPWIPYPVTGADQQDRYFGMLQMKSMGYGISVIAKIHGFQNRADVEKHYANAGIPLQLFPHQKLSSLVRATWPSILKNPALLDGAALEYLDPPYLAAVDRTIQEKKPDIIWAEYTTHWSILKHLKSFGIPVIIKSSLNEPKNCVAENGGTLMSRIKSIPKYSGERVAATEADLLLAITPEEEKWYRSLGATKTGVLPLRGLSQCFTRKEHQPKNPLDVVFLSSNYNMGHNRDALEYLITKILPLVRKELPGKFIFHLTGSKFPSTFRSSLADDLRHGGFIENLGQFLSTMDIAVCPWISGHGMQQKVFEPLCRSLPLLTTKTAGYPFENGKEVLLCATPEDYVASLQRLLSADERNRFAKAAYAKAHTLFSEEAVKKIVSGAIDRVTKT